MPGYGPDLLVATLKADVHVTIRAHSPRKEGSSQGTRDMEHNPAGLLWIPQLPGGHLGTAMIEVILCS